LLRDRRQSTDRILRVKTGNQREKAAIFEALIADLEYARLRMVAESYQADELRREMRFFERERVMSPQGHEIIRYHGPPTTGRDDDVHDDLMVALALANHGRLWMEENWQPKANLDAYVRASQASYDEGMLGGGGYLL